MQRDPNTIIDELAEQRNLVTTVLGARAAGFSSDIAILRQQNTAQAKRIVELEAEVERLMPSDAAE